MKRINILIFLSLCFCLSAQAQVGVYRTSGWGAVQRERVSKERAPRPTAMMGITGGAGVTASQHVIYPIGALGFDFAISATPNFALGLFTQWGILENVSLGIEMVHGDFMNHRAAFVWGAGFAMNARCTRGKNERMGSYYGSTNKLMTETFTVAGVPVTRNIWLDEAPVPGACVRIGVITPKRFYMTADLGIYPNLYRTITDRYEPADGAWYGVATSNKETAFGATISVGYAFGIDSNSKKDK